MNMENENNRYDFIILGASGFTGKYVVREALKFLNNPSSPLKSFAVAGRNPEKLAQVLKWASHPNPPPEIPILTANTEDSASLCRLAVQTKLILNCVGPFRLYGEPVVAACVASGCDYLDICGEPEFMERMETVYHASAAEKGSLVVSACGYDTVPSELGLFFNSRQWVAPAVPNEIVAYVSLESKKKVILNFTTYESAVLGVANAHTLQQLRPLRPGLPKVQIPGPCPAKGPLIQQKKELALWTVKLPTADASVVKRTFAKLRENPRGLPGINESAEHVRKRESFWSTVKPAHFGMKIAAKSLFEVLQMVAVGKSVKNLGTTSFGRWLLLTYPSVFSLGWFRKNGPTEDEVNSAFFKMWFVGKGFSDSALAANDNVKPDMEIITRVMGPEIGYVTTPIILVQCALILLSQRENLPKGGVFTSGIVFGPTDLQERLQENGISFDLVSINRFLPSIYSKI